jgi:hypothetical protein
MRKLFLFVTAAALAGLAAAAAPAAGLERLLDAGVLLGDTSGDGVRDAVRARVILARAAPNHLAAAAVIERLGFESAGMDFDLVAADDGPAPAPDRFPVVVGRDNRLLPAAFAADAPPAAAGRRGWAVLRLGELAGRPALFLYGSDPLAEAHAARGFFGRFPYLWEIWGRTDGLTYATVLEDVGRYLAGLGIRAQGAAVTAIRYENRGVFDRRGDEAARLARDLKGWVLDDGEIARLTVAVALGAVERRRVAADLGRLAADRASGRRTGLLNYPGVAELELRLAAPDGEAAAVVPRFSQPTRFLNRRYQQDATVRLDRKVWLDDLYSIAGFYGDGNGDRIPDDVLFQAVAGAGEMSAELALLAGRIALETAGCRFPLVRLDGELGDPAKAGPLLIAGAGNRAARRLGDLGVDLAPRRDGSGEIRAVNDKALAAPQLLVHGPTAGLTEAALHYLARYYPYLDAARDEDRSVAALGAHVQQVLQARVPAAAAAGLLAERAPLLELLRAAPDVKVRCELALDRLDPETAAPLAAYLRDRGTAGWEVVTTSREEARTAFEIRKELPWEGDVVRERLRRYLADAPAGDPVDVDVRLSEPAAERARLEREWRAELERDWPGRVRSLRVLGAYKQGLSWLMEAVLPQLRGRGVTAVRIDFQGRPPEGDGLRKVYGETPGWLQELFPADELLARELGLAPEAVEFRQTAPAPGEPVYRVEARDRAGRIVATEAFTPLFEERPFFRRFPSWGEAPVPMAGFVVRRGGGELARVAAPTDMGAVWDVYQGEVIPALEEQIRKATGGRPTPDKQPFFRRLTAELTASEPDERLGLDEEHVSALEAFHEDFYFLTLEFINHILEKDTAKEPEGGYFRANPFAAPGNVLPLVRPGPAGKGPVVVFKLELPATDNPQLLLDYTTLEPVTHTEKVKLEPLKGAEAHLEALYVSPDRAVRGARYRVDLKTAADFDAFSRFFARYRELVAAGTDPALGRFGLAALELDVRAPECAGVFALDIPASPAEAPAAPPDPAAPPFRPDHIVGPDECVAVMQRFAGVPGYRVFRAGRSYEGRPVFAAEILAPSASEVHSRVKLALHKPTLMLTGRQHANEVASTSYLLQLMELLARDPAWRAYRDKVNFVLHPMENPDGAALAVKLAELTPGHSLHAGRFTALGIDVGYEVDRPETLLTEARVRNALYGRWLPDIYLNLHGYPSHEWVQQFSGYTPYLFRPYWIPKGWFAYFRYDDSGLEPAYTEAGARLLQYVRAGLEASPESDAFNQRFYRRYERWAVRWQPHVHYLDRVGRTTIFHTRRSGTSARPTPRSRATFAEGIPELMDETAHGEFLAFLSRQGLAYLKAHLDYLSACPVVRVPVDEERLDHTLFQLFRRRPPLPAAAGAAGGDGSPP